MRRKTAVGLLSVAAAPAAFVGAGTVLLRLQAGRLRKDFTDAANAFDAPGTRTIAHPPRFALTDAPTSSEAAVPSDVLASSEAPVSSDAPAAEVPVPRAPGSLAAEAPSPRAPGSPPGSASASQQASAALAVLGDSWIAGSAPDDPARLLSRGLASLLGIPVRLTALAEPSARAEALITQVDRALADPHLSARGGPRIAVISMGTADIVFPVVGSITLGVLSSALSRLEREGFAVVVLCCPNLSSLPGIRNPLRTVLRRSSRVLAGSQWLAALAAGALPLSLTRILSGTAHTGLVDPSGQRPSELGRRQLAAAILHEIADRFELPRYSHSPEDE
ncbi:SGNH/GDSL hydrolase family protein [Brevibacterium yomogidense]|uniref:hypothetical protein n=1 Tax=Brevibacterium yomogidense TaxID=946573 RepID=UPI0018DFC05E|nr:hypothetical protein [Brevibacterium yomogidense]